MICLLSPAKKMGPSSFDMTKYPQHQTPHFQKKTQSLIKVMKTLKENDIKKLMKLSDSLSSLNYERYQEMPLTINKLAHNISMAGFFFQGDTYQGLRFDEFTLTQQHEANDRVFILSGLYGVLRVFDLIHAYRLEMGTKMGTLIKEKNLASFWKQDVTSFVKEKAKSQPIINLASKEYSDAVDSKQLGSQWIDVDFYQIKDGELKNIGLYAKRARGMLARFMVQERVQNLDELKKFHYEGYQFSKEDSKDDQHLVFKRPMP